MKIIILIGIIAMLSLTGCELREANLPLENASCDQIKDALNSYRKSICTNWTHEPIKNWECNERLEYHTDADLTIELIKKCK